MTRTLFTGGTVFDGTGAPPAAADVVVEGGRVVDVGPGLDGDVAVDCAGTTVLPGLVDCHVHVMLSSVDSLRMAYTPFSYAFYEAARNLQLTLAAGITTVRDAGGADLGVKQAVDDGLVVGPRMHISVAPLSITGGHGDEWVPSGTHLEFFVPHPGRPSGLVDGPDEVRRGVRQMLRAGADVIKVHTTGGVLSPTDDPRHAHFSPAELDVMVAEATTQGRPVMAHAQGAAGITNAVRAGIRSIEHGIYLDDEAIDLMLERGTWLVPTLSAPLAVIRAADAGASIPEASMAKAREVVDVHQRSFAAAVEAGVRIAMGTDAAVVPHGTNLDELPLMAAGGMSPERVLAATTSSAAELLGLQDEIGRLAPGMRADLVVVAGDALVLDGLRSRIREVWKDGVRVVGG
ncbi:metal-dependent hydrolase family protein [Aquipuribacter nitratireducens]|uniref:Amidohydrolase family protein n=1 Tax=Aquipuribacter nitratireducens TaxID=650104 RepID=A0ABW0GHE4_9MICO